MYPKKIPNRAHGSEASSDPTAKCHIVPLTPESSASKTFEHSIVFYNVSHRGPKNCTLEDLQTLHNLKQFNNQVNDTDKNHSMDDDGFTMVTRKKKQADGSHRITRGKKKL